MSAAPPPRPARIGALLAGVLAMGLALAACVGGPPTRTPPTAAPGNARPADPTSDSAVFDKYFKPLSTHGVWVVAEMIGQDIAAVERCVALAVPARGTDADVVFVVGATTAYLIDFEGMFPGATIILGFDDERYVLMEQYTTNLAVLAPGDDFAVIATLADPPYADFAIIIERRRAPDNAVFYVEGFRAAYAAAGDYCGFDTTPILGY